jgi:hypothetical protein
LKIVVIKVTGRTILEMHFAETQHGAAKFLVIAPKRTLGLNTKALVEASNKN